MKKITHPQKTRFSAASLFSTLVLGFLGLSAPTAAQAQDLPVVSEQPSNLTLPALPDLGGALVFGATPVGDVTGTRRVISVENPNEAEITITPALVNWTMNGGDIHSDIGDFALEPASLTLAAGASADLTLYFRPKTSNTKPGLRRCALQLSSDDEASHRIMLSGYTALPGGIAWVSNSGCHTLALKSDGSLWGCGYQRQGQLGSNLNVDGFYRATSYHLIIPSGVASIAACGAGLVVENDQVGGGGRTGGSFSLILMADGSLWGMGLNHRGQLGLGSKTNVMSPTRILAAGAASMSGSASHSMVIKCDGSLWACGSNNCGQLGLGSADTNDHLLLEPMRFDHQGDELKGIIAVSAAESSALATPGYLANLPTLGNAFSDYAHGLILKASGELLALGYNGLGQLSVGDNTNRAIPTPCVNDQGQPMIHVVGMAAATINSYALQYNTETVNGVAQTQYRFSTVGGVTGVNSTSGELGINTRSASNRFLRPGLPTGITPRLPLSTHSGGALWIGSDGNGYANGAARYYQLGQNNSIARTTPSAIVNNAAALISGPNSQLSIVLGQDGSLSGTGLRFSGGAPNYSLAGSKPLNGNMGELAEVGGVRDFTRQPVRFAQPARARYLSAAAGAAFSLDLRRRIIGGLPGADAAANTYNFALKAGSSLPSGFTLQNGLLSSSDVGAASATTSSFILQVTNDGNTQEATFEFAAMEISTAADLGLTDTSTAMTRTLQAFGGIGTKTWSVAEGSSLPEGLTLGSSTGAISGTALEAGSHRFTINCQDSATPPTVLSREFSLAVAGISNNSKLPAIRLGQAFEPILFTTAHTTAPVSWAMTSGSLPAGLSFDPATATLSGDSRGLGTGAYSFTLQMTDTSSPARICSKTFSLAIIEINSPSSLPATGINSSYQFNLTATCEGSPLIWTVPSGSSLPTGLTLAADGTLSGAPTTAGNLSFPLQVSVPGGSFLSAEFRLRILGIASPRLLIRGVKGQPYTASEPMMAEFNDPAANLTWAVAEGSALPLGMTISSSGRLGGTPSIASKGHRFRLQVTDSILNATAKKEFILPVFGFSNINNLPAGRAGFAFTPTLSLISVGGYRQSSFSLVPESGSLPEGLILQPAGTLSGAISGWGGNYSVQVRVTDQSTPPTNHTDRLNLRVFGPNPYTPPASVKVGQYYSHVIDFTPYTNPDQSTYRMAIQATGNQPLPAGITIDASRHLLSGRFTRAGTQGFRLVITDSSNNQAIKDNIIFNVVSAPYLVVEDPASTPVAELPLKSGQVLLPPAAQSGNPSSKTLRLRNSGDLGLSNPKLSISGGNQADFSVKLLAADKSPTPTTLAAGASASLLIQFAPKAGVAGLRKTTLTVSATPPQGQTLAPVVIELRAYTSPSGGIANVAAGQQHSLMLKADGSVWATGGNDNGQLGLGNNTSTNTAALSVLNQAAAIAAGGNHSLIIKTDGSLWAMGNNSDGQLGLADNTSRNSATRVITQDVTAISAGGAHSLLLKTDGSLWATGNNTAGQLGLGHNNHVNRFNALNLEDVVAMAAGDQHSLFLKKDGSLLSSGRNSEGQLGLGHNDNANSPTLTSLTSVIAIAAGARHSLALRVDGSLWACGDHSSGQLGVGSGANRNTWVQVSGCNTSVVTMAAGGNHSLILKAGTLLACGSNSQGQISGSTDKSTTPITPSGTTAIVAMAAGGNHSLLLKGDGSLQSLGSNDKGQLGLGNNNLQRAPSALVAQSSIPASLMQNSLGNAYELNLANLSIGGLPPLRHTLKAANNLPAGLSLTADGWLRGMITAPGAYNFTLQITDSSKPANTRDLAFSLSVFGLNNSSLPDAIQGNTYSESLQLREGTAPLRYSLVASANALEQLPPGLSLNSTTGLIGGTPTEAGDYSLTIETTDSSTPTPRVARRAFTLSVFGISNPASLPLACVGSLYEQTLRIGSAGVRPYNFTLAQGSDALPSWLNLDPLTGRLSGRPTSAGSHRFTIALSDSGNPQLKRTKTFTLQVNASSLFVEDRGSVAVLPHDSFLLIGNTTTGRPISKPMRLVNGSLAQTRSIQSISITGPNAADFSHTLSSLNYPLSLREQTDPPNPLSYLDFQIEFNPQRGSGTARLATISVVSNDPATPVYRIQLQALANANSLESQSINLANPGPLLVGQAASQVLASSSSGLPVTLSLSAVSPAGCVSLIDGNGNPVNISSNANSVATLRVNARGSFTLTATQVGDQRFAPAIPVVLKLSVTEPASGKLVLTNLNHVYDGNPKSAKALGLPAGSSAEIKYTINKVVGSAAPTQAGSYPVTATCNASIGGKTVTLSASATLVIRPAPLYLRALNQQRRILRPNNTLDYRISNSPDGPEIEKAMIPWKLLNPASNGRPAVYDEPKLSTTASISSPAGNYPISFASKGSSANYSIVAVPGTLSVEGFGSRHEALLSDAAGNPIGLLSLATAAVKTTPAAVKGGSPSYSLPFSASLRSTHNPRPSPIAFAGSFTVDEAGNQLDQSVNSSDKASGLELRNLSLDRIGNLSGDLYQEQTKLGSFSGRRLLEASEINQPYAGQHSWIIEPGFNTDLSLPSLNEAPQGSGFASALIASNGNLTLVGKLADGSNLSATLPADISANPGYRLFVQPYNRADSLISGNFNLLPHPSLSQRRYLPAANLKWFKSEVATDANYPSGFDLRCNALIDPWVAPQTKAPVITLLNRWGNAGNTANYRFVYSSTANGPAQSLAIALSDKNLFTTALNPLLNWRMTLTPTTGIISGSFLAPDKKTISFSGILRQPANGNDDLLGGGFCTNPTAAAGVDPTVWGFDVLR